MRITSRVDTLKQIVFKLYAKQTALLRHTLHSPLRQPAYQHISVEMENAMAQTNAQIQAAAQAYMDTAIDFLKRKIAMKAVSAEGISAEHMKLDAQFVADELERVGVTTRVVLSKNADGTPGAWEVIGEKIVNPAAKTVLLYAHHDVQPAPTDDGVWKTDPFVGTIKGDRLYGRGASDDGSGIAIHLGALAILGDELGVNVKFFIEGEEEMGSDSFIPFVKEHPDFFDADIMIVADSGNWSPEIPSLTTSLRGNTNIDVTVRVMESPRHSGAFGGVVLDANTMAALLIASMYNKDGELVVDGVKSQEVVGGLQQDIDEAQLRIDGSILPSVKLPGTGSLASRLWVKPSVTVIGFDAHPVEGSFNVISPATTFRLSLRTAPSQDPLEAQRALGEFMVAHAPFGCEVSWKPVDAGRGWAMDADCDVSKIAEKALEDAFECAPINQGQGGSIPFIPDLCEMYPKYQVLVTGPEDPQANAHSPNESQSLSSLRKLIAAEAMMLRDFVHAE